MSGDEKMSGLSIKLASQDDEFIKDVARKLNVPEEQLVDKDDFWEVTYLDTDKINEWQLAQSPDTGEIGLVYLLLADIDDPYFFQNISIGEMNKILHKLTIDLDFNITEELSGDEDAFKVFSAVYYNGTDSPFKF